MKFLKWSVYLLVIVVALTALPSLTRANGAPVKLFLNYLPEISNYGPTNAKGEAMISIGEAWIDLKAEELSQLDGVQYEAWLTTADEEQMISLGTFTSDEDGNVEYYAEFETIPALEYRFLIITVEADPDADPGQPDGRRTIAGVFPNTRLEIVSGTPTATLEPGITPTPGVPGNLPVTGQVDWAGSLFWWIGGFLLLGLGFILKKRTA